MTRTLHDSASAPIAKRAWPADREHAAQAVHSPAGAGRLALDETEERLSAVCAARFRHDMDPLPADLPSPSWSRWGRTGPAASITAPTSWAR